MNIYKKFINNQLIRVYRTCVFPLRKISLMVSKHVMFGIKGYADKSTVFDGDNYIGQNAFASRCHFGRGTYVADYSVLNCVETGKFCSIGSGVMTAIGKHPVRDNFALSPSLYSKEPANNLSLCDSQLFDDGAGKVILGNDVWIGNGVIILEGVTIGDGAAVGTGSVVTKSLEPYGIYVGNPAKLIGKRFDDETIQKLLDLKWWDKDDEWIKAHSQKFANKELD